VDIIVEKMIEEDLDEVVEIEKATFADPWPKRAFKYDLSSDYSMPMVAKIDKAVVGYANVYYVMDEMQIGNISVEPDFQHRGIGAKIMQHIVEEAKKLKITHIYLEVRESNENAHKLYYKFGFVVSGRRRLYYRHPTEDALIMVKEMN
jgi:[ribosomal protein S18]-alanine N-acetyltransferase